MHLDEKLMLMRLLPTSSALGFIKVGALSLSVSVCQSLFADVGVQRFD